MNFKDLAKWNLRVSALYAIGVWTMIGSYGYLRYTGRYEDPPAVMEEPEDPNTVVYRTPHTKTVIVYKKDHVPYSLRVSNFMNYFSGGGGGGGGDE